MEFPSKYVENAVNEISRLPGIGKKTALRLALHLLKQPEQKTLDLVQSLTDLRLKTKHCRICNTLSDYEICTICHSPRRDKSILCVVEDTRDVLALESTAQYAGMYFVLGGVISPLEGIGPADIKLDMLLAKFPSTEIKEVILALSPTIDGDTTSYYISKKLKPFGIAITTIARGIPVGSELEYMDEITLGRSIQKRIQFDNQ